MFSLESRAGDRKMNYQTFKAYLESLNFKVMRRNASIQALYFLETGNSRKVVADGKDLESVIKILTYEGFISVFDAEKIRKGFIHWQQSK